MYCTHYFQSICTRAGTRASCRSAKTHSLQGLLRRIAASTKTAATAASAASAPTCKMSGKNLGCHCQGRCQVAGQWPPLPPVAAGGQIAGKRAAGDVRSMLHGHTMRRVIFAIVQGVGQRRERQLLTDAAYMYARPYVAAAETGAAGTLVVLIVINGAGGGDKYGRLHGRLAQWRRGRGHIYWLGLR
jgi:hypothetical protein